MNNALEVKGLKKSFRDFSLRDITFAVPEGAVVGMIGENGSGKSTIVKCIMGQDVPQAGTVTIFGKDPHKNIEVHSQVGVCLDVCGLPDQFSAKDADRVFSSLYGDWDSQAFFGFLKAFGVPAGKKVRQLSKGMKAKLNFALALSHNARLLILDEATAGLDPVVREEILDRLREFMEDDTRSILMTSHITSDLERIADYILYIRQGRILFMVQMDDLMNYGLARIRKEDAELVDEGLVAARRQEPLCTELLVNDRRSFARRYPDYVVEDVSLDQVIVMLSKGETK